MRGLALSAGATFSLAVVLATAVAQQSPQSAPSPPTTFKSTTRIVNVNIVVSDSHGNPVTGLSKDDFELFDNGKPQKISSFDAVNNASVPTPPLPPDTYTIQPAAAPPRSVTALLIDVQDSDWPAQVYSLNHMRALLRQLRPDDRLAIYLLTDGKLTMLHDFTRDSSDLIAAIHRYDGQHDSSNKQSQKPAATPSELDRFLAGDDIEFRFSDWRPATGPTRVGNVSVPANPYLDERYPKFRIVPALTDVVRHLTSAPGRKSLIWVFGGTFYKNDVFQMTSLLPAEKQLQNQLVNRVARGYGSAPRYTGFKGFLLGPNGPHPPGNRDLALRDVRAGLYSINLVPLLVRIFNDNGIAVYPVAAQGLQTRRIIGAAGGFDDLGFRNPSAGSVIGPWTAPNAINLRFDAAEADIQGEMSAIAERTGGRAFYSRNDLETGIERALDDGRYSYEMAYYPNHNNWSGEWRKIEVKLKDPDKYGEQPSTLGQEVKNVLVGGHGVRVLARGGYFAFPDSNLSPQLDPNAKALSDSINVPPIHSDVSAKVHSQPPPDRTVNEFFNSPPNPGLPFLVRVQPLPGREDPEIQLFLNIEAKNLLTPESGNNWQSNFELIFFQLSEEELANLADHKTSATLRESSETQDQVQAPRTRYVVRFNQAGYQKAIEGGMTMSRNLKLQPGASMMFVVLHDRNSDSVQFCAHSAGAIRCGAASSCCAIKRISVTAVILTTSAQAQRWKRGGRTSRNGKALATVSRDSGPNPR